MPTENFESVAQRMLEEWYVNHDSEDSVKPLLARGMALASEAGYSLGAEDACRDDNPAASVRLGDNATMRVAIARRLASRLEGENRGG